MPNRKVFLMSLKDRLYYFLVEKNPFIREEYQEYVNEHQDEHQTNRGKHWQLLLKLNWHYRVLRKTSPLLPAPESAANENLPFLEGSESEAFQRIPSVHLAKDLLKYDVISFDIFDTLILRPFSAPVDLFLIIGERLGVLDFKKIRVDAEKDARAEMQSLHGHTEITIYDIYKRISKKTGIDVDKGVETELRAERDHCFSNPYMKQIFNILLDQGKEIVLTSDMYIPHDKMRELLISCGYSGYKKLYVSCDYSCGKQSGGLYKTLIREHNGKTIVHIGDNIETDIRTAKRYGLETRHYKNCHTIGNPYRAEGMSEVVGSFYRGIVNTCLHNGTKIYDPYYEYGFIYGGLYIVGFCNWIHQNAKAEGAEKILFLARGGDICQKVFNIMFDDIPNEYVYWSADNKEESEFVKKSFDRMIGDSKKIAVTDVVGDGSGPFGIRYMICNERKTDREVSVYMAGCEDAEQSMQGEAQAYIFSGTYNRDLYDIHCKTNNGVNKVLFEMFTRADCPSFAGFGKDHSYMFDMPEAESYRITRKIHQGIVDFCKQYIRFAKHDPILMDISGYDAYMPFKFAIKEPTLAVSLFADIPFSRESGTGESGQERETIADVLKER